MAILALGLVFQVDRRAAPRAGDLADLRPDLLEFPGRQAANELLLPQELEERREASVASVAREIGEPAALTQVETEHESTVAARTIQLVSRWLSSVAPVGVDFLEQVDDGSGRQLHADSMIEPKAGASEAEIDLHDTVIVPLETLRLHLVSTVRTRDRTGIRFGHVATIG